MKRKLYKVLSCLSIWRRNVLQKMFVNTIKRIIFLVILLYIILGPSFDKHNATTPTFIKDAYFEDGFVFQFILPNLY